MHSPDFRIRRLHSQDVDLARSMLTLFGEAFDEPETYTSAQPSSGYLARLLDSGSFIALAASLDGQVVGGIAAYELPKLERERSEIYLYDLAVAEAHRRQGIATSLIHTLAKLAADRGAYVIFVQADVEDAPAMALYSKLGHPERVAHFDIPVAAERS